MVGLEAGLFQVRIARSIGRSPSVVFREIARHRGPGGVYKAQDADRAVLVARRRPKKRLLDRDEVVRRRAMSRIENPSTRHPKMSMRSLSDKNRLLTHEVGTSYTDGTNAPEERY